MSWFLPGTADSLKVPSESKVAASCGMNAEVSCRTDPSGMCTVTCGANP
jgi:hypothetical protein